MCDSEEIPGSQKILLYLGDYKRNQTQNYQKDDLAGSAAVFSGQGSKNSPNRYLNISVPLTPALVDKNYGLRPQDVVPKLVDQLHWTVQQVSSPLTLPFLGASTLKLHANHLVHDRLAPRAAQIFPCLASNHSRSPYQPTLQITPRTRPSYPANLVRRHTTPQQPTR